MLDEGADAKVALQDTRRESARCPCASAGSLVRGVPAYVLFAMACCRGGPVAPTPSAVRVIAVTPVVVVTATTVVLVAVSIALIVVPVRADTLFERRHKPEDVRVEGAQSSVYVGARQNVLNESGAHTVDNYADEAAVGLLGRLRGRRHVVPVTSLHTMYGSAHASV